MSEYKTYKVKETSIFHFRKSGDFIKKKKLGEGGFGEIYMVSPVNEPENSKKVYALKVSKRFRSWKEVEKLKFQLFIEKNKDLLQNSCKNAQNFNLLVNNKPDINQENFIKEKIESIEEPAPKSLNFLEIRESCFLKKLQGKDYIVQFYDFCPSKDRTCSYILMEYVTTNIRDYLYQIQYDPAIINESFFKQIAKQILIGVQAIHSYGIIHRDIKPENILFDPEKKQVKISDFGLSREFNPNEEYTDVGTFIYKPPDVILGNKIYSFSFDIWSIGVILAEFLIGKSPFEGPNSFSVFKNICDIFGEIDDSVLPGISIYLKDKNLIKDAKFPKQGYGLRKYLKENEKFKVSDKFYDLIETLLVIDPMKRADCDSALKSPWFMEE